MDVTLKIKELEESLRDKNLYEICYHLLNPEGKVDEFLDPNNKIPDSVRISYVSTIVMELIKKREMGWMFLEMIKEPLNDKMKFYPAFRNSSTGLLHEPVRMASMYDYGRYVYGSLMPTKSEMDLLAKDSRCVEDPYRFFRDVFGAPGKKEAEALITQAQSMPYDGVSQRYNVSRKYIHQTRKSSGNSSKTIMIPEQDSRLIVSRRMKTFPRIFQKIAQKIAEEEIAHQLKCDLGVSSTVDYCSAIRNDCLGIKYIHFDERLVEHSEEALYKCLDDVFFDHPDFILNADPASKRKKNYKGDSAGHYDLMFPGKTYQNLEIIVTHKLQFWIDEFLGEKAHAIYQSRVKNQLSQGKFEKEYGFSDLERHKKGSKKRDTFFTKKEFREIERLYKGFARDIMDRGNQFTDMVHQYAGPVAGENLRHFFRIMW